MEKQKIINLIKKIKNGDSNCFDEFYNLTNRAVFYVILKIVPNCENAKDIMQETYISFLNSIKNIDTNLNFYSYILTIAKNKAIDFVRKDSRVDLIEDIDNIETSKSTIDLLESPLISYTYSHLSKYDFKILELTVFMGYKRVEVAKILNKPIATINWQYNKILKKIKKFYKEVYSENK